ncbi:MAG TPA: phosphatase PAP2 family protein [Candidatus Saccharimonadales bacterium]
MAQKKIKKTTSAAGNSLRSAGAVRAARAPKTSSKVPRPSTVLLTSLPEKEPRPVAWYVTLVLAALLFSASTYFALKGTPTGWEYTLFMAVNGWAENWYRLFVIITFFGGTWMAVISVGLFCLAGLYRLALRLALTSLGAYGAAYLAKHFIGRARPLELFDGVHARIAETGMGFPSGHATFITVLTVTLLPYLPKTVRWIVAATAIGAVSLSRVYLGVHLPLDIVGGIAIGAAAVAFIHILPKKLQRILRIN